MRTLILTIFLMLGLWSAAQTMKFGTPTYQNPFVILPIELHNNTQNITAISCKIKYDSLKLQFTAAYLDPYLLSNGQGAVNADGGFLYAGWFSTNYTTNVLPTHIADIVLRPLRGCSQLHWVDPSEVATTWGMPMICEFRDTTLCMDKVGYKPPIYSRFNILGQRTR